MDDDAIIGNETLYTNMTQQPMIQSIDLNSGLTQFIEYFQSPPYGSNTPEYDLYTPDSLPPCSTIAFSSSRRNPRYYIRRRKIHQQNN